jgi:hypothetical protein
VVRQPACPALAVQSAALVVANVHAQSVTAPCLHLRTCSVVVALPGVADPALHTSPSALHCCWVVHTWTLVTATVLLPWVRVWQRERHARRRFAWQRLAESAGEARAVAQAAPSNLEGAHQQPPLLDPPPAPGPAMARVAIDPWQLADDCRPAWAWVLDAYLLSCAAWAALLLYATARGF